MNLPKLDLGDLPGLDAVSGLFGSLPTRASDDTIVVIMVYVHDHMAVEMLL
ncbi:hypothetical protein [Erythrobacter sp. AP23]|uniref:hypothetical protein n=1 Tax=Erythrobacter sp. AP23 TaxID=499656 RepID=UPI000B1BB972|nr:hypothetical protein [Erythrobacter sp. AP23]